MAINVDISKITGINQVGNSYQRKSAVPLDYFSLFNTKAAAETYAATNAVAYVGQVISYIDNGEVKVCVIADAAGTLNEVGKATSGDGHSIMLDEETGVLSLNGFAAAPNATLPQKAPVYVKDDEGNDTDVVDHYELRWVAIDAIVEGDTNTKTIVALADGETHLSIETARDEANDTNTYKLSIDLSAYATTEAVNDAIDAAKEELQGKIDDVEDKFDAAIGVEASEGVEASGLYAAIAAAEERAKAYADANDADTVYDDTEVVEAIEDHETRIGNLETTVGDDSKGLVKAVADNTKAIDDEAKARAQADSDNLNSAKAYTDEEIVGLDIAIEKKTVGEVESDYIVIKNKAGTEVASVNAAKFVKDGMLDSAIYSTDSKKLTLTWNTDAGKNATEIDLNDLVNTYIGSDHIEVGTDGVISIKDTVALKSDVSDLDTKLSAEIDKKRTAEQVDDQIDAKLVAVNQAIDQKADAEATNTAIGQKADKSALESAVNTLTEEIGKKADAGETTTALGKKLDKSTYETDKATFALKSDVEATVSDINDAIDAANDAIDANGTALTEFQNTVSENYATKSALESVKATADAAAVKATVEAALATKIESATIAHAVAADPDNGITAVPEGVTKEGTALKIVIDAPTRAETAKMIADEIKDIAGEDSIPAVKADLNAEIQRSTAADESHAAAIATLTGDDKTAGSVAEAKALAQKGVDDAAQVASDLNELANDVVTLETGKVKNNAEAITALNNLVGIGESPAEGTHAFKIAALEQASKTHTGEFSTLSGTVSEISNTLTTKANAADVYTKTIVDDKLNLKANAADVYTKTQVADEIAAAIANENLSTYAKKTSVEAIYKAAQGETPASGVLADEITRAIAAEDAIRATVTTLVGADTNKSVRAIAAEEVASLVNGASDKYDTLKEIADFILNDETGAAAMANNISANTQAIAILNGDVNTAGSVLAMIAANAPTIATADKAGVVKSATTEGKVSVESDGTMTVNSVNVSKLTQTEGFTLILNGGNASSDIVSDAE